MLLCMERLLFAFRQYLRSSSCRRRGSGRRRCHRFIVGAGSHFLSFQYRSMRGEPEYRIMPANFASRVACQTGCLGLLLIGFRGFGTRLRDFGDTGAGRLSKGDSPSHRLSLSAHLLFGRFVKDRAGLLAAAAPPRDDDSQPARHCRGADARRLRLCRCAAMPVRATAQSRVFPPEVKRFAVSWLMRLAACAKEQQSSP